MNGMIHLKQLKRELERIAQLSTTNTAVTYTRKKDGRLLEPRTTIDMERADAEHYVQVLKDHLKEDLIKVEIKNV